MAVKTKTQLTADINNALSDNTNGDISASDLRGVLTDMVSSLKAQNNYINFVDKSRNFSLETEFLEKTINLSDPSIVSLPDGFESGWWCKVTNMTGDTVAWSATNTVQGSGTSSEDQYTSFLIICVGDDQWRVEGVIE